ncbi:F-BAR domain only protein 1-like isoform X2 [Anguilla anguilla]|uniref:F-BAR domain only protein 1-like isoform X2 n=1 Tax=Anguilla anguilla TaxID=7936 RepID=UPI0015AFCCD5|nr:F-BAR domain only protein 1-like isoform X2 [Anguilla anguilla]
MAFFKNNFWGEKNTGFDVLYHNMKHGQLAAKELAEFVRERAAIEETYSKSMSKLAKMASNGSTLGTFAPMWDVFRVSSDKLALCHLELMRKMNSLINDINKYGEEQVKIHRKTKEEVVSTLESVQMLQVQSGQLQKSRENYHSKCTDADRLRREGAPQKELEKAEMKSKKAAESFSSSVEKYNRVGGDFEQKMCESAQLVFVLLLCCVQKFQELEEVHLRQMKQLIKAYSHSIEDTHVQVGQVHEEFKQNVENIGIENLIKKFAEQKGTGTERPAPVGFEEFSSSQVPEGKKSRSKAFRIPGLGKRDKEPDSTDTAVTEAPNSPQVDDEGFVIRADGDQNGLSQEKDCSFFSSDSDFDDEEPKKFNIQIRPVGNGGRGHAAAEERELRATVGALTLPPNRAVSVKRHLSRNSSCTAGARSEGEGDSAPRRESEKEGLRRSTSSPDHGRLNCSVSGSEKLFGPPLDSAFKSSSFADAAFSSESSSPENVEDSGLDSPSHQPLGPSPEPAGWAAWPSTAQGREPGSLGRASDPFLSAFRDPSPGRTAPVQDDSAGAWSGAPRSPRPAPDVDPAFFTFPAFGRGLAPPELDAPVWSCKHIPPEDPFLAAFERTAPPELGASPEPWAPARPRLSREGRGLKDPPKGGPEGRGDPFASHGDKKGPSASSSSSSSSSSQKERDRGAPILESPEDPFSITIIGSPSHQSTLAAAAAAQSSSSSSSSSSRLAPAPSSGPAPGPAHGPTSGSASRPRKELVRWNSMHNPFSETGKTGAPAGTGSGRKEGRKQRASEGGPRRNGLPLTRHSGPQEDLCFSTENDQNCLSLSSQPSRSGDTPPPSRRDSAELLLAAPPRPSRSRRVTAGRQSGSERSRSLCSSPRTGPSPPLTVSSSSSSSPSEWAGQPSIAPRAASPARAGLSRGPSPISLSAQESWPVAAAITEYINAYFRGGEHNRCLVKITGDLTMSFPAAILRTFTANPNAPVLSFRLVNIARVDHFLPNQKLLYNDPSQNDPDNRDFWFNMQALNVYLQREAELNPQASYYNVTLLKYQFSSQDPGSAPLLLSAECQRSGTVTRVSLDYHCCPATAPATQLTGVQVMMSLDHTATDLQCQPSASWNTEERRLLWKLPNLSPTNHSKGSGTLCASWQCLEVPRGPPPSLLVQFVGSGATLSGMDVQVAGSRYRMSLVKKRFATGKYMAGCSI